MQTELYNYLKTTPEYKRFKRKSRMRSVVVFVILMAFWAIMLAASDFDQMDDVSTLYFLVLSFATFFSVKYMQRSFAASPSIVELGVITDIREISRTVNQEDRLQTIVSHQYLVHGGNSKDLWADCVYDFIEGRGRKHEVGESVIVFSMSPGNTYVVKYPARPEG